MKAHSSIRLLICLIVSIGATACSIANLRQERQTVRVEQSDPAPTPTPTPPVPPAEAEETPAATEIPATMMASTPMPPTDDVDDVQIRLRRKDGTTVAAGPAANFVAEPSSEPLPTPPAPQESPAAPVLRQAGPIEADKALSWLRNGNRRYVRGHLRADGQSKKDIQRVAASQKPHAVVLSCSDSRVPPEIIFDQKLGEIFVVRTAGPTLDQATLASVEYGVHHLGANLVVVLGHTSCGAVKAALESLKGARLQSPWLEKTISSMHPRLRPLSQRGPASEQHRTEAWTHVRGVAQDLVAQSALLRKASERGGLTIRPALYDMSHGTVEFP